MLNQFVLVGRVNNINKINDKECTVTLEIPRPFKNKNGEYENNYVDVIVKGEVAKTTMEHVVNNDLIGAKGRFVKNCWYDYFRIKCWENYISKSV